MGTCKVFLNYILISTFFISFCLASRARSRATYGEFCDNRTIRCDSNLSLTCKNQTCVCMKPENMIYDPTRRSCAALAGEKCRFTILEEYRSWQEEIFCVSHAHCDFSKSVCTCDRDYIELSNGTCIPKKNFNDPCDVTTDCKQDFSLVCIDSKCQCNPKTSEYSEELKQCVGLANEPCVNDYCTANAICREEPRRIYYSGGRDTSSELEDTSEEEYDLLRDPASVGRCQCRTAFGVTAGGKCKLGYGGKCDHNQAICMDWLKCKEGTCVCKYPTHQVYDKSSESCLSYVGGPCTNPEEGKNVTRIGCLPGAECARVINSSRFRCQCPAGYIENMDRGCDLDYGQKCRTQQSSTTSNRHATSPVQNSLINVKCDRIGTLFCIDGRCQCEDDLHVYDQTGKICKGLVGATCCTKQRDSCISGATCKARRGYLWQNNSGGSQSSTVQDGICTCIEYYREAEDRTCAMISQPNDKKNLLERPASSFALKAGATSDGVGVVGKGGDLDKKFNATANSLWAIFDDIEEV